MIIKLGPYTLDIDLEKTKEFYSIAKNNGCSCGGCRNFLLASESFPIEVKETFDMLGVDLKKAAEIITWRSEEEKRSLYYGGFYHICGKILSSPDCKKPINEKAVVLDTDVFYKITDRYAVGFSESADLVEEGFPEPAVQMEIDFHGVPWLLGEKNEY